MKRVTCIVLAAGKGVRMRSGIPKVLHNVCGQPILAYVLKTARACRARPIYVITGARGDSINKRFPDKNIKWFYQGKPRGTGHAVSITRRVRAHFANSLMVLCGDAPLITVETLNKLMETHHRTKDTACTILTCLLDNPAGYGRIVRNQMGQVTGIIEDSVCDESHKRIKEINSGIYVFNPKVLFSVLKEIEPDPKSKEYYLTDVVALLVKRGLQVEAYLASDAQDCLGINSREELALTEKIMQKRIKEALIKSGVTIVDPANTYIEAEVKIGQDTIIQPFTVIRTGVTIGRFCEVGPFAQLRLGTVLEDHAEVGNFTEVKKSRLGKYSKAKHLSYLGDTLVGSDVNIGAGTITANYDGYRKHQTVIGNGASTGSGTVLVAPVRLGKKAITGAGAVVAKGKDVPPGTTVVGIPARPLVEKHTVRSTHLARRPCLPTGRRVDPSIK